MKGERGISMCQRYAAGGVVICLLVVLSGYVGAYGQWVDTGLVQNGSFEDDPIEPEWPHYTASISGWTLTENGHLTNTAEGPFYSSALGPIPHGSQVHGKQHPGALSQDLPGLRDGWEYQLQFYVNCRNNYDPMDLTVTIGSHALFGPETITTTNPFRLIERAFVYDAMWGDTLTFLYTDPQGDSTILIDDVRLFMQHAEAYSVSYAAHPEAGGTVSGPATIYEDGAPGDSIKVTLNVNPGWSLVTVGASNGTLTHEEDNIYILSGVTGNTTIAAEFSPDHLLVAPVGNTNIPARLGDSPILAVSVYGATGPVSFQWYRLTVITPEKIPGATASSYVITEFKEADAGDYQCEVYDAGEDETAWSPVFTVTVGPDLPAASMFGTALAVAIIAAAGAALSRRRR